MDVCNEQFLNILAAALEGRRVTPELSQTQLEQLLQLAQQHKVLPMVCDALALPIPDRIKAAVRRQVALQAVKSARFIRLEEELRRQGLTPLVVKGRVCGRLYPNPDSRISADEDILIPQAQFAACCDALQQQGLRTPDSPDSYERGYRSEDGVLYIELHRSLFDPENSALGDWNRFFVKVFEAPREEEYCGGAYLTMAPTEHILYLICHAFKHFLHSGFGIRQVCDIIMYANHYGAEINWEWVMESCLRLRAQLFTAAIFRIGKKYLNFDPQRACYPQSWQSLQVDEGPLLEDLLSGGVYGGVTDNRKRSGNMTLQAVTREKQGKKAKRPAAGALFPPVSGLKRRYPYLQKYPWLLPVAWASRLVQYGKNTALDKKTSAAESVRIGNQRVELLRQYGVIS